MLPKVLTGAAVYVGGVEYVGIAASITPPNIVQQVEEVNMPGHGGALDIATGRLEKMDFSIEMEDAFPQLESLVGNPASTETQILLSALYTEGTEDRRVEYEITGLWREQNAGEMSGTGKASCSYVVNCRTLRHTIDGKEVRFVDLEQNIHRINGTDVNERFRSGLTS